jgi:hypothetical protein
MSEKTLSLLMSCHADFDTSTLHLQLVDVATGIRVEYRDGSFLLHISVDADTAIVRCLVRHVASGDEAHIQSGMNILAFIRAHIIETPFDVQPDGRLSLGEEERSDRQGSGG